jgi:hypothetical protein
MPLGVNDDVELRRIARNSAIVRAVGHAEFAGAGCVGDRALACCLWRTFRAHASAVHKNRIGARCSSGLDCHLPLTAEQEDRLRAMIQNALGYPFMLEFRYWQNQLPKAANGKFEEFVCLAKAE